jgi:glycosyltransferase involved in cell wall biosynthesis
MCEPPALCFGAARAPMARLVLVHDYLLVLRGAERTFAAMADAWPGADVVTLLFDAEAMVGRFAGHAVTTSPLQRLGADQRRFRALLPVLGPAARRLPTDDADRIVSSSSAFAHGVRKRPGAVHVCYCHSPFRYAWHEQARARSEVPRALRGVLDVLLRRHRAFDRRAAAGVDRYIANGRLTQERIRRFWGREADVLHPPVDVGRFARGTPGDHVLFVGELVAHKRPDAAIEAATAAGRRIRVVGTGPEEARLRATYDGRAEFLGRIPDAALAQEYASAAALVVPNVEEFGIAAVEAQAAGRPVVALDAGGTRETVVHGRTGLLVAPHDDSALARALREDLTRFDAEDVRRHAARFSTERFQARLRELVDETRPRRG